MYILIRQKVVAAVVTSLQKLTMLYGDFSVKPLNLPENLMETVNGTFLYLQETHFGLYCLF